LRLAGADAATIAERAHVPMTVAEKVSRYLAGQERAE
jgi:hypothetical protein